MNKKLFVVGRTPDPDMKYNTTMSDDITPEEPSKADCSIAWISVKEKLPQKDQPVVVYRPSNQPQPAISFHVLRWWFGDENDYTHWAPLEAPKQ